MPRYERVLRALAEAGVRFVVVGGFAVVLHGHPRLTADLDLVVDLEPDQIGAALRTLTGLGLVPLLPVAPEDFADPRTRRRWIQERNLRVFTLQDPSDPLLRVDLLAEVPTGVAEFADLYRRAPQVEMEGFAVRVASREDLIAMKRTVGRPQDRADIAALEQLGEQE